VPWGCWLQRDSSRVGTRGLGPSASPYRTSRAPSHALPATQVETKTRDNVFVTLLISVQYQVQKENV
jgi:hypothetical protein